MTRKFQKRPRGDVPQFEVGGHGLWTHLAEGKYAISSDGTTIIRACHMAYTRMLGSGVIHLDVAAAASCAEEFERA